jgi:hypothetical protein
MTQSLEHPPTMSVTPSDDDWYAALFRQRTEEYVRDWPDSWKAALEANTMLEQRLVDARNRKDQANVSAVPLGSLPLHED